MALNQRNISVLNAIVYVCLLISSLLLQRLILQIILYTTVLIYSFYNNLASLVQALVMFRLVDMSFPPELSFLIEYLKSHFQSHEVQLTLWNNECISQHFLEKLNQQYIYEERDGERARENERMNVNELAYVIVEAGKSKVCRAGWQAGDPGKT